MTRRARRDLRVALVSVGLGRRQRGFERMFTDLFGALQGELAATLFKSAGARSSTQRVPPLLEQATVVARALPLGSDTDRAYKQECLAYALTLVPELLRSRFDIIHCADPPLARVLQHLLSALHLQARLVFTEGCRVPPRYYPRAHVHHVSQFAYDQALAMGYPASGMTLIPVGVHTEHFARPACREELRRKYGIAESTFVVLAISSVERVFKRVDFIVDEFRGLPGDVLLWVDGHPTDPSVALEARHALGARCKFTYLPSEQVHELYHLADVMVHASLDEAFGLAVVEALCTGLPVLAHECEHFEWLTADRRLLVDMSRRGHLAARLSDLMAGREDLSVGAATRAATVAARFDWRVVTQSYVEMYRQVAGGTRPAVVPARDSVCAVSHPQRTQ